MTRQGMGGAAIRSRLSRTVGVIIAACAALLGSRTISAQTEPSGAGNTAVAPVPASWLEFAQRLQLRLQDALANGGASAQQVRGGIERQAGSAPDAIRSIIVRVWVSPTGNVERVAVEGGENSAVQQDLSSALLGTAIGDAPPDMPQPLRIRLSLKQNPDADEAAK